MPLEHHSYDQRPDAVSGGAAPGPAPGKRTKTEGLRTTGVPFVDDGTKCEREAEDEGEDTAARDCFLTENKRTRLATAIMGRAGIVGANSRDALQDSRIDELVQQPHGWGALAEFMFYSATGPLIAMVAAGVAASRFAKATEDVKALMTNVSRAQRKQLQGMVSVQPGKESKVRFLEMCRDAIGPWQKALFEEAPRDLDDAGLTALKDALDPDVLTVDFFKDRIADMLSRFGKQQIDQVGIGPGDGAIYRRGELVYLGRGNRRRLVMLEDYGVHNHAGYGTPKPRDLVQKLDHSGKPIVIDPDLEPMAVLFYQERTGRTPMHMDVEAAVAMGGNLGKVASDLLVELLTLGATP